MTLANPRIKQSEILSPAFVESSYRAYRQNKTREGLLKGLKPKPVQLRWVSWREDRLLKKRRPAFEKE